MAISMYRISVSIYVRHLTGLVTCLKRAQAFYAEKKYDESTLLNYRFYPDMYNFTMQIHRATNHARESTALLAGLEAPKYEDNEKSLAELIARVEKTIAYLKSIKPEQVDGSEGKTVTVKIRDRETKYTGLEYLLERPMPNFYFHSTTAYDIMRHNGVELSMHDLLQLS